MLQISRRTVRQNWALYLGCFVAVAVGVLLLGLAANAIAAGNAYANDCAIKCADLRIGEAAHDQVHLPHAPVPGAIQDLPAAGVEAGAAACGSAHGVAPI